LAGQSDALSGSLSERMEVMHEDCRMTESVHRLTLMASKYVKELEASLSVKTQQIEASRKNYNELEAKFDEYIESKKEDAESYQRQIEILSEQLLNYDEALKELRNLAVEKLRWLDNEQLTAKQKIEAALNHISELQETNKKLLGELQKTKDDVIYEKQAKAAWIITYQKEDIKSSKLRKRRNQLIRQLKDNGIEPVKPS